MAEKLSKTHQAGLILTFLAFGLGAAWGWQALIEGGSIGERTGGGLAFIVGTLVATQALPGAVTGKANGGRVV